MRHGKRLGETLKLPRLSRVSGASRSQPACWKLQHLGLGDMGLESRRGLDSEGLMHIPVTMHS